MKLVQTKYHWGARHIVALICLVTAAVFASWEQWKDIFTIAWNDEEASHILLVIPIAVWLVWIRRIRFRRCPPKASWVGFALAVFGWALSAWSYNNAFDAGLHGGAVLMLIGAVTAVVGTQVIANQVPGIAILLLLIPVPGAIRLAIAGPLQNATARATTLTLELFGFWVERSGNLVIIDGVPVAVAEACNGMRMVFALILVVYAFAFTMPLRNSVRILVLLLSPVTAILCNVIRLTPTVLLYGRAPAIADQFHEIAGWLMLPIAFLLLVLGMKALRWALIPTYRFTLASQSM